MCPRLDWLADLLEISGAEHAKWAAKADGLICRAQRKRHDHAQQRRLSEVGARMNNDMTMEELS